MSSINFTFLANPNAPSAVEENKAKENLNKQQQQQKQ